jgi:hypothetical protein
MAEDLRMPGTGASDLTGAMNYAASEHSTPYYTALLALLADFRRQASIDPPHAEIAQGVAGALEDAYGAALTFEE